RPDHAGDHLCGGDCRQPHPGVRRGSPTQCLIDDPMTKELEGKVAIVTGAGRNIGRGIALALADGGAAVVVNARANRKETEAVAGEIARAGGKALAVTGDVADADAVDRMVAAAAEKFGRIDILVNNAAIRAEQPF